MQDSASEQSTSIESAVSIFNDQPFFEKVLIHGIKLGLIDSLKIATINEEAPKCIVQIARFFGSEYLRPDLETARTRVVNLVGLYLHLTSGVDLQNAALILRDKSLMFCSKSGAEILKEMIVKLDRIQLRSINKIDFSNRHIPQLSRWSLAGLDEIKLEIATRNREVQMMDMSLWLIDKFKLPAESLQDQENSFESIIRTTILLEAGHRTMPQDWNEFNQIIAELRRKDRSFVLEILKPPNDLPAVHHSIYTTMAKDVISDLDFILDKRRSVFRTFYQTPRFILRYTLPKDILNELT